MENFEGKRLLILGGAPQTIKIVRAAKALGIYTIIADVNKDAPAKEEADEGVEISLLEKEKLLEWCKANPVDGIINLCVDFAQKTLQYLCGNLGLPCFGNAEQVRALTDKQVYKKMCAENGLDTIPEYSEDDIRDGKAEYPLFVKPAESSGSRGAKVCHTKEEAIEAIGSAKQDSRNGSVIIEKYMGDKPDFMVTYIFIDGEAYLQRTTDRYHGHEIDGMENVGALAVSPSKYTDLFMNRINDKMIAMLKKLEIKTCAVFSQGFVDGDKIRFYDPAIRLTGANFENILKKATGIDVVTMFVEYALTGKITGYDKEAMKKCWQLDGKMGAIAFPMVRPGVIKKIEGIDRIENDPRIVSGSYRYKEGYTVKKTGDVTQRFGEYNVLGADKDELISALRMIRTELRVYDENGEDMVISKPDLSMI